jgi:TctA family transporter
MRLFHGSTRSDNQPATEPSRLPHRWATILGFSGLVGAVVGGIAGFAIGGLPGLGTALATGIGLAVVIATWLHKAME